MLLAERVSDAQRVAKMELKDLEDRKKVWLDFNVKYDTFHLLC